jgi:hypothetical protein
MILNIGLMMGFYIITKMVAMISRKDVNVVSRVFAILTVIVTSLCLLGLVTSKGRVPPGM